MCFYRFKTKITEPSPEYAQWLSKQRAVEDIINFANDFTYVSDLKQFKRIDYWQTPSEFFINKKGDCDEVHFFIADAIYRALGYESYVFVAWRFLAAHAMTIYKKDNQYFLINYRDIIPMNSLRDKEALKETGFNYISGIWRMPDGKKV